jgi:hypothetical protein
MRRSRPVTGENPVRPGHDNLHAATRWLVESKSICAASIEQAARQFDLSPADEEFLTRTFLPVNTTQVNKDGGPDK